MCVALSINSLSSSHHLFVGCSDLWGPRHAACVCVRVCACVGVQGVYYSISHPSRIPLMLEVFRDFILTSKTSPAGTLHDVAQGL
jgi:hypothetical protein